MVILTVIGEASIHVINAGLNGPEKFLPCKMKQNGTSSAELKKV
jgi:hypothetical protein